MGTHHSSNAYFRYLVGNFLPYEHRHTDWKIIFKADNEILI